MRLPHRWAEAAVEVRGYMLPVVVASRPVVVMLRCISLYMLALGLTKFEALYMITVFEGFMIISGAISGASPSDTWQPRPATSTWQFVAAAERLCTVGAPFHL